MPSLKALIALETSAAATMRSVWSPVAKELMAQIQPLLDVGKYDEAHYQADRLTLFGVVTTERNKLEELAVSAILFGAHNAAGSLQETSFVKGKTLPREMKGAIDQLVHMVEQGGGDIVRKQLHAMIATAQEEVKSQHFLKAEGQSLAARLNEAVIGSGRAVIDIGANLTTSRLINLGFLAEAVEKEITRYQVNETLDSRTCAVCRYMHGKVFTVGKEFHRLVSVLGVSDPKDLRSLAPWPGQSRNAMAQLQSRSLAELQSDGFASPPYHPGCRGVLSLNGAVTENTPVNVRAPELNELLDGRKGPAEAASVWDAVAVARAVADDFVGLTEIADKKGLADLWNTMFQHRPRDLTNVLLKDLPGNENVVRIHSTGAGRITIDLNLVNRNARGREVPVGDVTRMFYRNKDGKLIVDHKYFKLAGDGQGRGTSKLFMGKSMDLYKRMGVETIKVHANINVGGYAWARYGFLPDPESWDKLRAYLQLTVKKLKLTPKMRDAIKELTRLGTNGDNLFLLSTLEGATVDGKAIGKALLIDSDWHGTIDLNDAKTMQRFWDYVRK